MIGRERRVRGLIRRDGELRLCLLQPGQGHRRCALAPVVLELADEVLLVQVGIRLELGLALFVLGFRRRELRLRAARTLLLILRIEPGEHLAFAHEPADLDVARDDLSRDAEAEIGLIARAHFSGIGEGVFGAADRDTHDLDRPNLRRCRRLLAATRAKHRQRKHAHQRNPRRHGYAMDHRSA